MTFDPLTLSEEDYNKMFDGRKRNFLLWFCKAGDERSSKDVKIRIAGKIGGTCTTVKFDTTYDQWKKTSIGQRFEGDPWTLIEDTTMIPGRYSRMLIFMQPPRRSVDGYVFTAVANLIDEIPRSAMSKTQRKMFEKGTKEINRERDIIDCCFVGDSLMIRNTHGLDPLDHVMLH